MRLTEQIRCGGLMRVIVTFVQIDPVASCIEGGKRVLIVTKAISIGAAHPVGQIQKNAIVRCRRSSSCAAPDVEEGTPLAEPVAVVGE